MNDSANPRARLLREVWRAIRAVDTDNVINYRPARRAIDAGASPSDLVQAMTLASYEIAFRLLFLLTAEHAEEDSAGNSTGWMLTEAGLSAAGDASPIDNGTLDFLHEDLLGADPTGAEGRDLFT